MSNNVMQSIVGAEVITYQDLLDYREQVYQAIRRGIPAPHEDLVLQERDALNHAVDACVDHVVSRTDRFRRSDTLMAAAQARYHRDHDGCVGSVFDYIDWPRYTASIYKRVAFCLGQHVYYAEG